MRDLYYAALKYSIMPQLLTHWEHIIQRVAVRKHIKTWFQLRLKMAQCNPPNTCHTICHDQGICVITMEFPKMNPHVSDIFLHIQRSDYTCLPTGTATVLTRELADDVFFCPSTQASHMVAHKQGHLTAMCSGHCTFSKPMMGFN